MLDEARRRTTVLMGRMADEGIHTAVFTDESSIAYLAGFWGYLGIEFGRPTMLVLSTIHDPVVITPLMESEMAAEMTWVDDIRVWEDAGQRSWDAFYRKCCRTAWMRCGSSGIVFRHLFATIWRKNIPVLH